MRLSQNRSASLKRLLGAIILVLGIVWLALTLMGVATDLSAGFAEQTASAAFGVLA